MAVMTAAMPQDRGGASWSSSEHSWGLLTFRKQGPQLELPALSKFSLRALLSQLQTWGSSRLPQHEPAKQTAAGL